jgi:ABC-2 type transport system permease protein
MSTTTFPVARRHPFWALARAEAKLFLRSPASVVWTGLMPVVALVVLSLVPATRHATKVLHGLSYLDVYLPILMVFSLCMSAVNLQPPVLATYREKGILRRLATTPVPPSRLLGAQALIYLGIGLAIDIVLLVVAVAFGVAVPAQLGGLALSLLLVAAATLGIGMLIAAASPSGRVANAVSMMTFFPLMFFGGLWLPRAQMPSTLRTISDFTPLGAGVRAMQASIAGHWPSGLALVVMAAYAAACGALATRLFRWE